MKIDAQTLLDTFKYAYSNYQDSIEEADEVVNLYHNRQYNSEQLAILADRGQPAETFNVIKAFSRMMIGYYSTTITKIKAIPHDYDDIQVASLLTDTLEHIMKRSQFEMIGDTIKLNGMLTGLMTVYYKVEPKGTKDKYGRPHYNITLEHINANELLRDPLSQRPDYSDARFTHRFKWLTKDKVLELFGKAKLEQMTPFMNVTTMPEADYTYLYTNYFNGLFTQFNNYLVVHTIIKDDKGKWFSVYWHNNIILDKQPLPVDINPYRTLTLYDSNRTEFYGVFREVVESQKAINQAIIQIQLLVNSNRAIIEAGAVDDVDEFIDAFNRVNGVIVVESIAGIKIEKLNADIQQQYLIIDKALDRIQRVLGINDSFLGMAFASDSGAKVQLQQKASVVALRYLTSRIEQFYKFVGEDLVGLIKHYYTAEQVLRVADDKVGERWVTLNQPIMRTNSQGAKVPMTVAIPKSTNTSISTEGMENETTEEQPTENELSEDEYEKVILNYANTSFEFNEFDIDIQTIQYDDDNAQTTQMVQQLLEGSTGQMLAQVNPEGYLKTVALVIKDSKLKRAPDIVEVLEDTAKKIVQQQQQAMMQQQQQAMMQQQQQAMLPQGVK